MSEACILSFPVTMCNVLMKWLVMSVDRISLICSKAPQTYQNTLSNRCNMHYILQCQTRIQHKTGSIVMQVITDRAIRHICISALKRHVPGWWTDAFEVTYCFEACNTIIRLWNVYGARCFIALGVLVSVACLLIHSISSYTCWFAALQGIATVETQMCYTHTQDACPVWAIARNAHSRESSPPICSIRNCTRAWHQAHPHSNHPAPLRMFNYHYSHMHVVTIGYGISAFSGSF